MTPRTTFPVKREPDCTTAAKAAWRRPRERDDGTARVSRRDLIIISVVSRALCATHVLALILRHDFLTEECAPLRLNTFVAGYEKRIFSNIGAKVR